MKYFPHISMNFEKVKPWGPRVLSTLGPHGFTFSKFIEKWGKYLIFALIFMGSGPPKNPI
jgi:hypothetical protein